MKVDTVIRNCRVVRPEGTTRECIGIDGGKIVALATDENLLDARRTIDAGGNYVIPGVLDNHMHLGGSRPLDDDTRVDTAACAFGGITTISNMIGAGFTAHQCSYTEVVDGWIDALNQNTFTDVAIDAVINSETHIDEIPMAASRWGIALFKLNLGYKERLAEHLGRISSDDGILYLAQKAIADLGPPARLKLHCENIEIINRLVPQLRDKEKRQDLAAWTDSRPGWVEALDIERAVSVARITKAPLYIVHLSSSEGVDAVARAKEEGIDVIAETCPPYLTLTKHAAAGIVCKVRPPLRDEESIERMWEGIKLGIVQCMGSDNVSFRRQHKEVGIWEGESGYPAAETYLPLLLSEGVNKGRITIEKLVEVCCANNAKAEGIYPQKGVIRVGSDADLTIVDLDKTANLSVDTLHQFSDFCIHEGWEVKGYPVLTMLRGKVVVEDGKLIGEPGVGRYLTRAI